MNTHPHNRTTAMTLLVLLAVPFGLTAQDNSAQAKRPAQHHHYKLVDLDTFGGPASYFPNGFDGILNNPGTAAGWADTSTSDPYPPFCFNPDCYMSQAFQSRNGVVTGLGVLPSGARLLPGRRGVQNAHPAPARDFSR